MNYLDMKNEEDKVEANVKHNVIEKSLPRLPNYSLSAYIKTFEEIKN